MQNAFMSRMENDIAKRDSDKRVNEMKKTAEGRRVLKQLGMLPPPSKPVSVGKLGAVPTGAVRGHCLRCARTSRVPAAGSRACWRLQVARNRPQRRQQQALYWAHLRRYRRQRSSRTRARNSTTRSRGTQKPGPVPPGFFEALCRAAACF